MSFAPAFPDAPEVELVESEEYVGKLVASLCGVELRLVTLDARGP
jgi:hypothetical protein